MTGPIYAPKGHAAPYAKLALNPYLTCPFRCPYCYNAVRNPAFWSDEAKIRSGNVERLLMQLEFQCSKWQGDKHPVHMTFLGDCYQPVEIELNLTRHCIEVLHKHGFPVQILTKAPELPARDFDLLGPRDKFGMTATAPDSNCAALVMAEVAGIKTWLSLEPVLSLDNALGIIRQVAEKRIRPDPLWIGPLNHAKRDYDWPEVKARLKAEADRLGLVVQFKDEARQEQPAGRGHAVE